MNGAWATLEVADFVGEEGMEEDLLMAAWKGRSERSAGNGGERPRNGR